MNATYTDAFLVLLIRRLQAVAELNRIRIIMRLESGEATVQDLTDGLDTTHQNVSKHLAVLLSCGIVSCRKDGNKVWYALADFSVCRLVEQAAASTTGYVEELAAIAGLDTR